jgi:hypothetical protein
LERGNDEQAKMYPTIYVTPKLLAEAEAKLEPAL